LLKRAGELGLLAVDIDEAHGGLGLDKVSSTIVAEAMGWCASFWCRTRHVCIGTRGDRGAEGLPHAGGEIMVHASPSPPRVARRAARRSRPTAPVDPVGHQDVGFRRSFTVFAKIDGEHFSAFLVERGAPGLSFGHEERKMGIKGSSTRAVNLDQVRIPVGNLLGARGQGGKIALNVLNVGRYKLGAGGIGGARVAMAAAVAYAKDRRQFGRPIAAFGAIRQKLAQMATRIWAGDAMVYRTVGNIDRALDGLTGSEAILKALEEYAIESSILKIVGSESLCFVADEAVQVFGGNGFSAEYPVDRFYRDARINRIFEGTNEINRLLVPTMLLKRAAREELGFTGAADALRHGATAQVTDDAALIAGMKRCARGLIDLARQRYGDTLAQEQEVVLALSDIVIDVYVAECAMARAAQAAGDGADAPGEDFAQATMHDGAARRAAPHACRHRVERGRCGGVAAACARRARVPRRSYRDRPSWLPTGVRAHAGTRCDRPSRPGDCEAPCRCRLPDTERPTAVVRSLLARWFLNVLNFVDRNLISSVALFLIELGLTRADRPAAGLRLVAFTP
jgi:hypothetical protein